MNEQKTWPDLWENSSSPTTEASLNSEAIKKLENLWVERKTAIKLAELRWDIHDNEIQTTLEQSQWQKDIVSRFSEVRQVLDEHKQKITEQIAAHAMSERIRLWQSISNNDDTSPSTHSWNALMQSVKTSWRFVFDAVSWIKTVLLDPKASMQYMMQKADWQLTDSELNYTIT